MDFCVLTHAQGLILILYPQVHLPLVSRSSIMYSGKFAELLVSRMFVDFCVAITARHNVYIRCMLKCHYLLRAWSLNYRIIPGKHPCTCSYFPWSNGKCLLPGKHPNVLRLAQYRRLGFNCEYP